MKLDDIKIFAILKNGIGIKGQKSTQTSYRSMNSALVLLEINPKAFVIHILTVAIWLM